MRKQRKDKGKKRGRRTGTLVTPGGTRVNLRKRRISTTKSRQKARRNAAIGIGVGTGIVGAGIAGRRVLRNRGNVTPAKGSALVPKTKPVSRGQAARNDPKLRQKMIQDRMR